MKQTARTVAFQTLKRVYEDDAYTNVTLQHALSTSQLAPRDKGLCTELVYGTVRRQLTLDVLLEPHVKRRLQALDVAVLTLLRMSVYQLAYLTRVPAYAVIDEAVNLAKVVARRASGFVNGVLRSYLRDQLTLDERLYRWQTKTHPDECQNLSIRHSYPGWMVQRLLSTYGSARTEAILAAGNEPLPLTLRVNPLRMNPADAAAALEAVIGQDAVEPGQLSPQALRTKAAVDVEKLPLYSSGALTLQDEGAMLIAPLLQAKPGMRILDMCAAPGGKTTHIAELQQDQGEIDAYDVYLQKVRNIQAACQRLGLQSVSARLGDAREIAAEDQLYDAVLVDAPCSGLGVMRRRPDLRYRRKEADIASLVQLQQELLLTACKVVRPGGVVVYATCTLLPEENQQVVQYVLQQLQGKVTLDDIKHELPPMLHTEIDKGLLLTPERFGTDGFYMARLRKQQEVTS
ncbi:16S rRNA (cytosine(967)-C(5))-methyltransferase RsmB [Alicyclobacillus fodiniaquatilis]|uniref:16S rRNA (cytosine(967)-C(5))-methyltransferase n=1 Tax=Alicyclobacillus fodiniaquatilis TaxID=1661150 RepID=A0ABW4JR14_9BACL